MSIVIALSLPLPFVVRLMIAIGTGFYGRALLNKHVLLLDRHAIQELYFSEDGWSIATQQGIYPVELGGESTITAYISVLRFHMTALKLCFVAIVLPDSLKNKNDYRRLVVSLRTTRAVLARQITKNHSIS